VPNVTHVFYGRDVGYTIERLVLDETTETISATEIRRKLRGLSAIGGGVAGSDRDQPSA